MNQSQNDPTSVDPILTLSGTSDPNTLVNPAIDSTSNNYIVWVAAVEDNPGILDSNTGDVLCPSILDPSFNNLYIRCRLKPYVSEHHYDVLRNLGAFQEGDKVNATEHRMPALNPNVTYTNNQVLFSPTPVAGTVSKSSFAYSFNTTNPDDHALVPG
jgi:hypothetical protein